MLTEHYRGYRVDTRNVKINSYYRASQCLSRNQLVWWKFSVNRALEEVLFTKCSKVNTTSSIYQVTLHLPSHQWLPSSELCHVISMDRAFTSTEWMMMLSNVVDIEYQKVTESVYWTWVIFYWDNFVMIYSLVFWPTLQFCELEWYIYEMYYIIPL